MADYGEWQRIGIGMPAAGTYRVAVSNACASPNIPFADIEVTCNSVVREQELRIPVGQVESFFAVSYPDCSVMALDGGTPITSTGCPP